MIDPPVFTGTILESITATINYYDDGRTIDFAQMEGAFR
jgi:hypothetical protein